MSHRYETVDWYDAPQYYDIIFDADTAEECRFLEAMCERHCTSRGKRVLEPACGTGRLMAALAKRGFEVTGFDLNPAMLQYARRRLDRRKLKGRLTQSPMQAFRFPHRFDMAYNLISTFKYLETAKDAHDHLRCVADALRTGGIYVLGFHLTDYTVTRRQRERWVGRRGKVAVTCNIQSWPPDRRKRQEAVRCRLDIVRGNRRLKHETHWTFRTYSIRQFGRLLAEHRNLQHVATYDFTYDSNHPRRFDNTLSDCIVVLRRVTR